MKHNNLQIKLDLAVFQFKMPVGYKAKFNNAIFQYFSLYDYFCAYVSIFTVIVNYY